MIMESVKRPGLLLTCAGLQALIDALVGRGYQVLGPAVRDGAIVYDAIARVADLPAGWTDHQEAGRYRICGRPAILEAIPASAGRNPLDDAPG